MKKSICITLAFICCHHLVLAQKYVNTPKQSKAERVYNQLMEKLDIIQYLNVDSLHSKDIFWESLDMHHSMLQKYKNDVLKNKKAAQQAIEYIGQQLTEGESDDLLIIESQEITEELENAICGSNSIYPISINIIHHESANAFIYPNGKMYITDSLLYLLNFSRDKIIGICAHEMGHYIIQHAYVHQWKSFKNERNNTIIAAIMSGIVAAADAYAISQGAEIDSDSTIKYIENTFESASIDSYLYRFKYSREQELEADIIAVRFLEWLNIDPMQYIRTLELLGTRNDYLFDEESDHPTISYRIELLTHMIENFPMQNWREFTKTKHNTMQAYPEW